MNNDLVRKPELLCCWHFKGQKRSLFFTTPQLHAFASTFCLHDITWLVWQQKIMFKSSTNWFRWKRNCFTNWNYKSIILLSRRTLTRKMFSFAPAPSHLHCETNLRMDASLIFRKSLFSSNTFRIFFINIYLSQQTFEKSLLTHMTRL